MIYADNAATTKLDSDAFEAMKCFLLEEYGNPSQPYSFARASKRALINARKDIADCIGADPEEIYFTSGGSESDNWAIKGIIEHGDYREILTSEIEHHAILHACKTVESFGYPVVYMAVNNEGILEPDVLKKYITNNTKMVSIMMANNEIGTIEPIKELAKIAHANGAIFHTDAVQAVGHVTIDVKNMDIDMLSASGHKFNAPRGVGFLYIRKGIKINPLINGGAQELNMRAGTENVAAIVSMATALKKNCENIQNNTEYLHKLENHLIKQLNDKNIDFIRNGYNHIPGNISLSFKNYDGEMILHRLDLMGIMISTGSACNGNDMHISHVIKAIKVPIEYAKGTIRISLSKENTMEEVQVIADSLCKIIKG